MRDIINDNEKWKMKNDGERKMRKNRKWESKWKLARNEIAATFVSCVALETSRIQNVRSRWTWMHSRRLNCSRFNHQMELGNKSKRLLFAMPWTMPSTRIPFVEGNLNSFRWMRNSFSWVFGWANRQLLIGNCNVPQNADKIQHTIWRSKSKPLPTVGQPLPFDSVHNHVKGLSSLRTTRNSISTNNRYRNRYK